MGATKLFMLVDDNDVDLFLNKKLLRTGGITENTIAFHSAQDALNYLRENANRPNNLPSVILLDVLMPEMNGFQFLEMFEKLPESVKSIMKIVMLSSTIDPVDLERARANRYVVEIMRKPLDTARLRQVLA